MIIKEYSSPYNSIVGIIDLYDIMDNAKELIDNGIPFF